MNWVSILVSMIGGGIGGAVGTLVSSYFPKEAKFVAIASCVVIGVAGAQLIESLVGPASEASFEEVYAQAIGPKLHAEPFFARVFKDFPEQEAAFKAQLKAAYDAGGLDAVDEAMAGAGAEIGAKVANTYLPRATDDALVGFANIMVETLSTMNKTDPEACVLYQYGTNYGKTLASSRLQTVAGQLLLSRQSEVLNTLIATAQDAPPNFDRARGAALIREIGQRHRAPLDDVTTPVASGERAPATREEASAACTFSVRVFQDVVALPPADTALVLRTIYSRG